MSLFNELGALKAVLIKGTNYRKIDNTLYSIELDVSPVPVFLRGVVGWSEGVG